ncbi:MAG: adenylosuccinate synthetase, partial [Candidatus Caldarchaeum sp.]
MSKADIIIGLQWGDEGKGKISYVLSHDAEAVVRFQGGANAGHTVMVEGQRYKFNMLPAGCLAGPKPVIAFLKKLHGVESEADLNRIKKVLAPYLGDVELFLNELLDSGGRVVLEGAQGVLLDIDHGTYPYVTSSNTVAAAGCVSTGIPISKVGEIVGVMKAYTTRVGAGPFPTEVNGSLAE